MRLLGADQRTRALTALVGISLALAMAACSPTESAAVRPPASDAGAAGSRSTRSRGDAYADGVYAATGQYGNQPSSIGVTVTLVNPVITAVEVTPHATEPTSLELQRAFAAAVPAVVVGRRIEDVRVDRLAGSSGTPDGFNAAIQQIREQARAAGASPS